MSVSVYLKIKLATIVFLCVFVMQNALAQCNFTDAPLGEICTTAEYICGSKLNGYVGKLRVINETESFWNNSSSNPKAGVCNNAGQFDNTSWFSFTACSSNVHLRIHFYNCVHPLNNLSDTGIQTGLFSECRKSSSVACQDYVGSTSGVIDLQYSSFIPGQLVYFVLDGYAASVCEFRIEIIDGLDTTPVTPPDPATLATGSISGPTQIACSQKNTPITFNLVEPERAINFSNSCSPPPSFNPKDSVCYAWSVTPAIGWFFDSGISTGHNVNIQFTEPGTYTISADAHFNPFYVGSCANVASGDIHTWTVTVLPENVSYPDPIYVCPGDSRYFCGQQITADTTIICDADPCNVVHQRFIFGTSQENDMGVIQLCRGGSFDFQGVQYSDVGNYSILDNGDCSLVHKFTIESLDIQVDIQYSALTLDCSHPTIDFSGLVNVMPGSTVVYNWYDANNRLLGSGNNFSVSTAGLYTLNVDVTSANGAACSASRQIQINADFEKPKILVNLPLVRCKFQNERSIITISSLNGYSQAEWTTPLGSKSNQLNLEVDSLNAVTGMPYLLTLTGSNGCVLDTSFVLNTNFERPFIALKGDNLTCYTPAITIEATTNISIDSIRWNKVAPDQKFFGSHLTKLTHEVNEPGIYKVDAMATNSKCWNSETIDIQDDMVYPDLSLDNTIKWHCNTVSIDIKPIITDNEAISYSWNSKNGSIVTDSNSKNITAGKPGVYRLTATNADNGCTTIEDLIIEEETNKPSDIEIETNEVLCFGEHNGVLIIHNTRGGFTPYRYFLNNESITEAVLDNLESGVYTLEVRDAYDCSWVQDFVISEPVAFKIETDESLKVEFNETATLSFVSNYSDDEIASILWLDAKGNVLSNDFEFDFAGIYSEVIDVIVTTVNGCVSRSQIHVQIDNELKVYFPNIFSPNGDGVNDRLVILKNKIPADIHRVAVYDRFGNVMYSENGVDFADEGWDGTFRGSPVQPGVYIILVELTDFSGKKQVFKQDLTVVR